MSNKAGQNRGGEHQLEQPNGRWCLVGNISKNIISGFGDLEYKSGTKLFRGGAKVYLIGWYRGGSDSVVVIGQHRKSRSFIKCAIALHYVTSLRAKVVYHPKVNEIRDSTKDKGVFYITNENEALDVKEQLDELFVKENARKIQQRNGS